MTTTWHGSKLRAAVVGHGKVGRIRQACIEAHPRLELVSVCDVNGPSGPLPEGCRFHADWRDVLEEKPDLLFVCTTNEFIPDIAVCGLESGLHVFCEKPPGRSVEDVERMMVAEAAHPSSRLMFGFNHRYHQAIMDAKSLVDRKRLGNILWMRGVYGKAGGPGFDRNWRNDPSRSGGGILIDQGIHMLDLFHLFVGEFQEIKSFVNTAYWNVPVEDNAFAIMRNRMGQTAMIHSSATQWRHTFLLDIYLEKGYLSISGILSSTRTYGRESMIVARSRFDEEGYPLPNPQESVTHYDDDHSWALEVDAFVRCVLENRTVESGSSRDALAVMKLVRSIYQGDANGSMRPASPESGP
ncbi:MAG: Gfo/Idh/MocA family oxidoreductase [Magnetococcales bacterium]|nr:Gfo/Idh/MocA family oxidoreductase [Magnetococcales bacterium]